MGNEVQNNSNVQEIEKILNKCKEDLSGVIQLEHEMIERYGVDYDYDSNNKKNLFIASFRAEIANLKSAILNASDIKMKSIKKETAMHILGVLNDLDNAEVLQEFVKIKYLIGGGKGLEEEYPYDDNVADEDTVVLTFPGFNFTYPLKLKLSEIKKGIPNLGIPSELITIYDPNVKDIEQDAEYAQSHGLEVNHDEAYISYEYGEEVIPHLIPKAITLSEYEEKEQKDFIDKYGINIISINGKKQKHDISEIANVVSDRNVQNTNNVVSEISGDMQEPKTNDEQTIDNN